MDILQKIDTNVSSMVSSSFDEIISTKVKEAVEKEKEKFLADLNMCEEEFLIDNSKEIKNNSSICNLGNVYGAGCCYVSKNGIIYGKAGCDGSITDVSDRIKYLNINKYLQDKKEYWNNTTPNLRYFPTKLNNEYLEILEIINILGNEVNWNPLFFHICDIYKKYHPRANENFVIEEKIKKLSQIEKVVEEKVEEEKNSLEKQKEIYSEKIKQVNEEKLKRIFSMFILRNEKKENIKDKSTIREMIKRSNDKCKKKEREVEINLEKQRNEFQKEKEKFYEEKIEYENTFKSKVKSLLDMANDINEINELQDDTLCKSGELFSIMKRLNEFI